MEIETLFKNYMQTMGLDPASSANSFVATFYNKYPNGLSKQYINYLKEHIPKYIQVSKP